MNSRVKNQVVIQARMGSTRLPGKTALKLGRRTVLEHVVRRSGAAMLVNRVVVATTELAGDDELATWCDEHGIPCVRGSSEEVIRLRLDSGRLSFNRRQLGRPSAYAGKSVNFRQ